MRKVVHLLIVALAVSLSLVDKAEAKIVEYDEVEPIIKLNVTRIGQADYKVAGNVTVINKKEIDASNALNVPDILKEALGVNVYNYGTIKSSNIDIRGFGETAPSNVLVLLNDRKINSVDLSGPDLQRIPIGSVERIEIIRGAGSVLYGDNAVGGVVNIITKKGEGEFSGRVGVLYGDYGTQREDVEVSGSVKNFNYFLYANYLDNQGYRVNSDVLAKDFSARLGYNFSENFIVDLNLQAHEDKFGLPGSLLDSQIVSLGRKASTSASDFATTDDKSVNVTFDIIPWPDDKYYGHFVIDYLYRDRDVFDLFACCGNTKRDINTHGVTGKYIFDRLIFDKEVNFITGVDYYDNTNVLLGGNGSTVDATITKEEVGIYGLLEYEVIDKVYANAGTRYHMADYKFDDRAFSVLEKREANEKVSMGGLKYEYAPKSNAHFNVQQTFRNLATDEWYSTFSGVLNTDLKQQSGIQYEAGIKHNYNNGVEASLTGYRIDIDDEIYFDPRTFANSNYDKTRRHGVEVGTKWDILKFIDSSFFDRLWFASTFTYQNPEFSSGDNKGKDIPLVPRHQWSLSLNTAFWEHFKVSVLGRFVGSRYKISDIENEAAKLKPYKVFDTKWSYTKGNYELYTAVSNIFDVEYISTSVFVSGFGNFNYPSSERTYSVGMNVRF